MTRSRANSGGCGDDVPDGTRDGKRSMLDCAAPASLTPPLPPMLLCSSHSACTLNVCRALLRGIACRFFVCAGRAPVVSVHAYDEAVDHECRLNVDAKQQQGQDLAASGRTEAGEKGDDTGKEGSNDDDDDDEKESSDDTADEGEKGRAGLEAVRSSKKKRAEDEPVRIGGSLGPLSKRTKKQQGQGQGDKKQVPSPHHKH